MTSTITKTPPTPSNIEITMPRGWCKNVCQWSPRPFPGLDIKVKRGVWGALNVGLLKLAQEFLIQQYHFLLLISMMKMFMLMIVFVLIVSLLVSTVH